MLAAHRARRRPALARAALRPELSEARARGLHNIGQAAALTGVSAKMIRHYEAIGLLPAPPRTFAGYRLYGDADLHRLRFIRRARTLGFPMKDVQALLGLWDDQGRASAEVKALARRQIADLDRRIAEMEAMKRSLDALARRCHGNQRPDCPSLDDLAG